MEKTFEELKAHLMANNEEFRLLANQHSEYGKIVDALESKSHLTDEEKLEEVKYKKLKLRLKDQMTEMMSRYRQQATV